MRHPERLSHPAQPAKSGDQVVVLHGVSWSQYLATLQMRGEGSGTRIAYLDGELELMTPSRFREDVKTTLARLLEAYAEECDLDLNGYGSWTLKQHVKEAGAEPDECYVLGPVSEDREVPDLAIEVVATSGGVDKLEIYRRLGVPEVWFWDRAGLSVYVLDHDGYAPQATSVMFPKLDLKLLQSLFPATSQTQAVRTFRAALRGLNR